jgi:hypothetical protein
MKNTCPGAGQREDRFGEQERVQIVAGKVLARWILAETRGRREALLGKMDLACDAGKKGGAVLGEQVLGDAGKRG